jgi:hypothetical protein
MKIPKGLTETEVLDIIDKVVNYLAPSFRFGYFDAEDMKQEGSIFCLEALESFNFDKSNQEEVSDALFTFLRTHVRWRFLNMRRKQLKRIEPPICDCELCLVDSTNRMDCKKYSKWVERNNAKRNLMEPFNVQDIYTIDVSNIYDIAGEILCKDLLDILNQYIPVSFRADYRRFIEGVALPKARREKIIKQIKIILATHYSRETAEWGKDEDG